MAERGAAEAPGAGLPTPAVLFIVFNRPEPTRAVFAAIRAARPSRLYVAADGPRAHRAGEAERCAEVRAIATAVDWPCQVQTLLRGQNLGCRRAVSGAISWFFEHEPEGVIIEDDCLPSPDFFRFCAFALAHWRDDPRVLHIGGHVLVPRAGAAMGYSRTVPIWGWATWRRAWALYDERDECRHALAQLPLGAWFGRQAGRLRRSVEAIYRPGVDAWGGRWLTSVLAARGLSVLPGQNLVSNIGFGPEATHTVVRTHLEARALGQLPAELPPPPGEPAADPDYDERLLAEQYRPVQLVARARARLVREWTQLRARLAGTPVR